MIISCSCVNEYQDKVYGKGLRVHNPRAKTKSQTQQTFRCTVCKAEKVRSVR